MKSNCKSYSFSFFKDGATPLYAASQEGHVEVVKELIKRKANIDAPTKVSGIFVFILPKNPIFMQYLLSPFLPLPKLPFLFLCLFLFLFFFNS